MDPVLAIKPEKLVYERLYLSISQAVLVQPFLKLPSRTDIPEYYEGEGSVQNPISLTEIRNKIDTSLYKSIYELRKDVKTMFANARIFNPEGTPIHEDAKELEAVFEQAFSKATRMARAKSKKREISFEDASDKIKKARVEDEKNWIKNSVIAVKRPRALPTDDAEAAEAETLERKTRQENITVAHLHKTLAQGSQLTNLDREECSMPWLGRLMGIKGANA